MHHTRGTFLISLVFLCVIQISTSENNQINDTFVPTHQWKVVKEGQQIPPGLHVRLNLQTGLREAKFMDTDELNRPSNMLPAILNDAPISAKANLSEPLKQSPHVAPVEQNNGDIKKRFRSYDELKREFDALQLTIKTDAELLTNILQELRKNPSRDRMHVILEDLSYLLHQVDNGKMFAEEKGLNLLKEYFYDDNDDINVLALSAFRAAIQGNGKAKIIALQDGLLDELCNVLSALANSSHPRWTALSTGVSTLGAMLRHFPSAQNYFFATSKNNELEVKRSGLDLLSDLFLVESSTGKDLQVHRKLQIQILCLIGDILNDRMIAKNLAQSRGTEDDEKLWQLYKRFSLQSELLNSNWCDRLTKSLLALLDSRSSSGGDSPAKVDHDSLEKLLNVVLHLGQSTCKLDLDSEQQGKVHSQLAQVQQEYASLAKGEQDEASEPGDTYFSDMHALVQKAVRLITKPRYTDEM